MTEQQDLPNKLEIQRLYESYAPVFNEVLANIEAKLKASIKIASIPTFKTRIKSFTSYYKKILRQKPKEAAESKSLVTLTDMIGIRVICAFLEDLDIVEQQLVTYFNVKEIERKGAQQSFPNLATSPFMCLLQFPKTVSPKKSLILRCRMKLYAKYKLGQFFRTHGQKWSMS